MHMYMHNVAYEEGGNQSNVAKGFKEAAGERSARINSLKIDQGVPNYQSQPDEADLKAAQLNMQANKTVMHMS